MDLQLHNFKHITGRKFEVFSKKNRKISFGNGLIGVDMFALKLKTCHCTWWITFKNSKICFVYIIIIYKCYNIIKIVHIDNTTYSARWAWDKYPHMALKFKRLSVGKIFKNRNRLVNQIANMLCGLAHTFRRTKTWKSN